MRFFSTTALFLLASFTFLSGCGSPEEAIEPESLLASKPIGDDTTKSIACYYYDPTKRDFGQSFFVNNLSWVWATNDDGNYLYVEGRKEDGFFVIDKVYSSTFFGFSKNQVLNQQDRIEELCQNSILSQKKDSNLKLYAVLAKKNTLSSEHPPVFEDRDHSLRTSRLVIFGDSLSDTGNLLARTKGALPKPPYFLGRFANGPVWSDYLRDFANLAVDNWAFGGAQTTQPTDDPRSILGKVLSRARGIVTGAFDEYVMSYVKADLTTQNRVISPEKTTYAVWIGANDVMSKFEDEKEVGILIDQPDAPGGYKSVNARATNQIQAEIEKLHSFGAFNFLVLNLPDLGIIPKVVLNTAYHQNTEANPARRQLGLSKGLTRITQDFNARLKAVADNLRAKYSDIHIVELDIFNNVKKLIAGQTPDGESFNYGLNPAAFAITIPDPDGPPITAYAGCFVKGGDFFLNQSPDAICADVASSFFFDDAHPTSRAHCWLSYLVHNALYEGQLVDVAPNLSDYSTRCLGG